MVVNKLKLSNKRTFLRTPVYLVTQIFGLRGGGTKHFSKNWGTRKSNKGPKLHINE